MSDYISQEALKEALENADADVCESYPVAKKKGGAENG